MIDSCKPGDRASWRRAGRAAVLGLGLALGGCSTMSDIGEATTDGISTAANAMNPFNWFGGDEPAAADEDRYPKLSTVPERPKEATSKRAEIAREDLREGLVADTANAQYTDKELRAQTAPPGGQGAAPGQPDLARSNERVSGEPPAQPAPTMPVAASPAAPLQAPAAPPSAARSQTPSDAATRRQAAAASAAPVMPVAPPTAAPPTVASPPAPSPQRQAALSQPAPEKPSSERLESVLKTVQVGTIYFNDGSTSLSADDREVVDKIADVARRTGGTLRIVGHASVGPPSRDTERKDIVNYKVSLERANSVAEELVRTGIPSNRMQVLAEGARNPIYAETSRTGAAGNRRAEIYLEYRERL